ELSRWLEEQLLVVLAMDVAQVRSQLLQESDRGRPVVYINAALASRLDFAIDHEVRVGCIETRGFKHLRGLRAGIEDAGDTRAVFARTDHVARRAPAEQKAERIHHDGLPAAGFACEKVESRVKTHAEAVDYRIIFHHQFKQHPLRL